MKRILINATHAEEIRVALCKGNHLYDFDLENRTREQKKANIYKGHVTRVEPSLEAVFVEYGSERQGFLPIREIAQQYLKGNPRDENIKSLIKEGDTLIVQVEKEERGNKGAALSTYVSLAGRYLVLMPNNPRGGGISRQISGKIRDDMKRLLSNLEMPKGMSVIIRTAGIGKSLEDLQHDLNHLLSIWQSIQEQNDRYASPRLVHQEAGVVTRAVRDYLRDDIGEIWIDSENAYHEAANFITAVMPTQSDKLRKYTDYEPMFSRFGIEKQIETAYQREVRLPSGGSIVIDQTEAMVSIDINSAKSTKGSDVAETAYHTNLEAADEIARQLRLRDMGGLIVIDFIDMNEREHQKDVEKRLVEACRYDRARVQFGEISKFGLMEMSRQRLRPSLEESTGYICPRCHGNGMIRDLRSLSLSIMRQIEQTALKERQGEVQAEVPTDIAAFLLNEKRESLVYLEQDSGTRITILPHAHMESPNYTIHFNRDGFAPSSYERITDSQQQESHDRGYEINWQTAESERPEQQPTRKPRQSSSQTTVIDDDTKNNTKSNTKNDNHSGNDKNTHTAPQNGQKTSATTPQAQSQPQAIAWLTNLFTPTPQAVTSDSLNNQTATQAIESLVNSGATSLGAMGQINPTAFAQINSTAPTNKQAEQHDKQDSQDEQDHQDKKQRKPRKNKNQHKQHNRKKDRRQDDEHDNGHHSNNTDDKHAGKQQHQDDQNNKPKREPNSQRDSRGGFVRHDTLIADVAVKDDNQSSHQEQQQDKQGKEKSTNKPSNNKTDTDKSYQQTTKDAQTATIDKSQRHQNPDNVEIRINRTDASGKTTKVVHLSLDDDTTADLTTDTTADMTADVTTDKHHNTNTVNNDGDGNDDDGGKNSEHTAHHTDITDKTSHNDITDDTHHPTSVNYDWHSLFANRYVTAEKYGNASNDPRVVMASKQAQSNDAQNMTSLASKKFTTNTSTITGSVGQFIHRHLPDAQNRIKQDGVIACFIKSIELHHAFMQTANGMNMNDADNSTNITDANHTNDFDFSNYGYQPLSDSYLSNFADAITPVAKHQCVQGKTEVAPTPLKPRASNDPRGTHHKPAINQDDDTDLSQQSDTEAKQQRHLLHDSAQKQVSEPNQSMDTLEKYKNMIENVAEQMLPKGTTRMILSSIPVGTNIPKNRKRKKPTTPKANGDTANAPKNLDNSADDTVK